MGSYWESKWRNLGVELAQTDWSKFRTDSRLMRHIENPTTGRVLAMASRCVDEFAIQPYLLFDSLVGSPPVTFGLAGGQITRASVEHARMAWAIDKALYDWGCEGRPVVVEIGGGFGGLAWQLCRASAVEKYAFVDHPAVLRVQRHFVDGLFEAEAVESQFQMWPDFSFIRADEYEKHLKGPVDVVVNTRSMMEMDQAEVNRYFGWIASVLSPDGIFYSVNRLEKVTRLEGWPWDLFEIVERRRWPTYLDLGPMDEIIARLR